MNLLVYAKCGDADRAPRNTTFTLPGILSDPLVRLVMKADGVDPKALERELWDIAALLPPQRERCSSQTALPRAC